MNEIVTQIFDLKFLAGPLPNDEEEKEIDTRFYKGKRDLSGRNRNPA